MSFGGGVDKEPEDMRVFPSPVRLPGGHSSINSGWREWGVYSPWDWITGGAGRHAVYSLRCSMWTYVVETAFSKFGATCT